MMQGVVNPFKEAIIALRVFGRAGAYLEIDAVIDTGFSDYLTLSAAHIAGFSLSSAGAIRVTLADGSATDLGVFLAEVEWDGATVPVTVLEADGGPLVGMSLLYGCALNMEVVDGGPVYISKMTRSEP